MKIKVTNDKIGSIEYYESFWTGKKEITINGKKLTKIGKNQFSYVREEESLYGKVNGNFFLGATLGINGEVIELVPKTKVVEWVLVIVPLILILVWGNVPFLCAIFPIAGGVIGGAVSGGILTLGLIMMKKYKSFWIKLLVSIISTIVSVVVCFLIALLILTIFPA